MKRAKATVRPKAVAPTSRPATTSARVDSPAARARELVAALEKHGGARTRDALGPRFGIHTTKAFGVPTAAIQRIARGAGRDHALAQALWETGWYEARLLAAYVDEPERVTAAQMDRWSRDFDNWGVVDTVCFVLFDRTPHALAKVKKWSGRRDEFGKRAAFALLASVALHDQGIPDSVLQKTLPLVEAAASDDRNFVRKGVVWAMRALGGRSTALHSATRALAERLAASPDRTVQWVGRNARKELSSPALLRRLKKRR